MRALAAVALACLVFLGFSIWRMQARGGFSPEFVGVKFVSTPQFEPSLILEKIEGALGGGGPSLAEMRGRISEIAWVKNVAILRRAPNKILVQIMPKKIIASLYMGGKYYAIDEDGRAIDEELDAGFPIVATGAGAAERVPELLFMLRRYPRISAYAVAARLVGGMRWDVVLYDAEDGLVLRLPPEKPEEALAKISALDAESDLLKRDIEAIDARADSRLLVKQRGAR
jgi:cell division protein FtsQ